MTKIATITRISFLMICALQPLTAAHSQGLSTNCKSTWQVNKCSCSDSENFAGEVTGFQRKRVNWFTVRLNTFSGPDQYKVDSACVHSTSQLASITPNFWKREDPTLSLVKRDHTGERQNQQPSAEHDAQELAKKLSNPVASLISVPFQSNFDFGMGGGSGWRYTLNFQPVIPIALNAKWNLISRTILPIIHQSNVVENSSQTGLGDITQSFFFSPADSKRFIWAVGPALLIPTATNGALGTRKFGIGPTALILKQEGPWTYGLLANHIWSIAGSDSHPNVNNTFLQPFFAYNTRDAWTFGLNTESSYDWTGNHWSVPIHFSITKLTKFGDQPVSLGGALRCWAESPPGGPKTCGLRILITPLFPK